MESKELHFEDGSDLLDELEKEKEKSLKDTEKYIKDSEKVVDEINNAEEDKVKFKDVSGKALKIKQFTEQLHLDEEEIEEDIPRDLAKAYKKTSDYFNVNRGIDYHNATYNKISKEEAEEAIKNGQKDDIRVLIDGKLVTLNDTGKLGGNTYRNKYVDFDKRYNRRTGTHTTDTAHMPASHIFSIADAIYLVNEPGKDPTLMAARKENPGTTNYDAPNIDNLNGWYSGYNTYKIPNYGRNANDTTNDSAIRGEYKDIKSTDAQIADYRKEIRKKEDQLKERIAYLKGEGYSGEDIENDWRINSYKRDLASYRRSLGSYKDSAARTRYVDSETKLQTPIAGLNSLKGKIPDLQDKVTKAKNVLDDRTMNGSEETRRAKSNLRDLQSKLIRLRREISDCLDTLDNASVNDAKSVQMAQDEFDVASKQLTDVQDQIKNMLTK